MLIEAENLNYTYPSGGGDSVHALKNVSVQIEKGEFLALAGSSGSGKSTFVKHLNALLRADSGELRFQGEEVYRKKYPVSQLRRKVGLVFQYPEHQLFSKTVLDDVAFGPKNMGATSEEAERAAKQALERAGIGRELYDSSPYELSGGQMRKVAIAGVLAMKPEVLVLDEPTAGLDPYSKKQLFGLLKEMQKEGVTIIFVSHSMEEIAQYADRVIVFKDGQICLDGVPEEMFQKRETVKAAGLEMPEVMEALWQMRGRGVPIGQLTCQEERAVQEILNVLNDRRNQNNV